MSLPPWVKEADLTAADIKKLAGNRSGLARIIAKRFRIPVGTAKQVVNDLLSDPEGRGRCVGKGTRRKYARAPKGTAMHRRTELSARVRRWLIEAKLAGRLADESGARHRHDETPFPPGAGTPVWKFYDRHGGRAGPGLAGNAGSPPDRTGRLAGESGTKPER
jgi:hypothetical protein